MENQNRFTKQCRNYDKGIVIEEKHYLCFDKNDVIYVMNDVKVGKGRPFFIAINNDCN